MTAADRTKLLAARFRAASDRPYFAAALFSLTVVESEAVPTMAVDARWRCYVNPAFVTRCSVEELAGVWIHEVSHLLRAHHDRAARLPTVVRDDHRRINLAMDCEINDDLIDDGLALPHPVLPAQFGLPRGGLFEAYLPSIPKTASCENCGSGAHGIPQPWEGGGGGEIPSVGPVEAEALRRQVASAIRSSVQSRGAVPGGWIRWAEGVLQPKVDWRRLLVGAVREALAWASGASDYTYARPSRRQAVFRGVVLPSLRQPLPRVAIVIDTSGSMGEAALLAALAEVHGVLRSVGVGEQRVTVLSCDARVQGVQEVSSVAQIELRGGGGTDMAAGIEAALARRFPPQVLIVLTDGLTPWPPEAPACRIIAGLIGKAAPLPPHWIETVRIEEIEA